MKVSEWMAAGLLEDGRGTNRDFAIMSAINSNQNDFWFPTKRLCTVRYCRSIGNIFLRQPSNNLLIVRYFGIQIRDFKCINYSKIESSFENISLKNWQFGFLN